MEKYFIKVGPSSTFHSVTHSILEKVPFSDKENITNSTDFRISIEEENGKNNLITNWDYKIYYAENEIYNFISTIPYEVSTDIDKKNFPSFDELKNLVIQSYDRLRQTFNERRKEFEFFEEIGDISNDKIQQSIRYFEEAVSRLQQKPSINSQAVPK